MSTPEANEAANAATDEKIRAQIFEIVRAIPMGKVMSYGALGKQIEPPISGYICGRIMQNVPQGVPWWRVVGKDGNLPIRKRHPELAIEQREKLGIEGVRFGDDGRVRMEEFSAV